MRLFHSSGMDILLSRKSGIRHLIMLGICMALTAWTYIALSLSSGWDWLTKVFLNATSGWEAFAEIGMVLGLLGAFSALVYWCGRCWMLYCLRKAFVGLFGWLPFVRRLDPDYEESQDLGEDFYTEEDNEEDNDEEEGCVAGCLAAPVTVAVALLLRCLKTLGYLVCSVGIPVLTPALITIVAWLIHMLCAEDAVTTSIVAIVLMVIGACVLVVHPILVFVRKPHHYNH